MGRMPERARALDLPHLQWDVGAPMPVLIANGPRTLVAYYLSEPGGGLQEVQTVEFVGCTTVMFGFPNDEVLDGHRLYERGLEDYRAHVVEESAWVEELREIERHHYASPEVPFADSKHYVLVFHDEVLEAVAMDLVPLGRFESMGEAIEALAQLATA